MSCWRLGLEWETTSSTTTEGKCKSWFWWSPTGTCIPSCARGRRLQASARKRGHFRCWGVGAAPAIPRRSSAGLHASSVDTVVLVHVLCGIPDPRGCIELYHSYLRPGGQMLFFEHVASEEPRTRKIQDLYTELGWRFTFDGCHLNRPTGAWIVDGPHGVAIEEKEGITLGEELRAARNRGARDGAGGRREGRWSEFEVWEPEGQQKRSCIPQIVGWARKA